MTSRNRKTGGTPRPPATYEALVEDSHEHDGHDESARTDSPPPAQPPAHTLTGPDAHLEPQMGPLRALIDDVYAEHLRGYAEYAALNAQVLATVHADLFSAGQWVGSRDGVMGWAGCLARLQAHVRDMVEKREAFKQAIYDVVHERSEAAFSEARIPVPADELARERIQQLSDAYLAAYIEQYTARSAELEAGLMSVDVAALVARTGCCVCM